RACGRGARHVGRAGARASAGVPLGCDRRRDCGCVSRGRRVILIDADVLGRNRTGDETYVRELLRALPEVAADVRIGALTREASPVPEGIEPVVLRARTQELRMAVGVPRLLRQLRPALAHFVHSLPLHCPIPAVLTVQDLSWERDPSVFGWWDLA